MELRVEHPAGGAGHDVAARRIDWIAAAMVARGVTGVGLKVEGAELIAVP